MSGTQAVVVSGDMHWISAIDTGCQAATTAITKTAPALRLFIREVREARAELDAVLAELHSLEGVVDILRDDARAFPPDLARRTPPLLAHCTSIVEQIAGYMHVCNGLGLTLRDKKFRWLAIRVDMEKLRRTLEGYKAVLAVVVDLVGLNKSRKDNDAGSVHSDSSDCLGLMEDRSSTKDDIRTELTHVMADMGTLRGRLQGDFRSNYAVADLESYLDAMQLAATTLGDRINAGYRIKGKATIAPISTTPAIPGKSLDRRAGRHPSSGRSSSVGDEPDSAIDINDGPPSPYQASPTSCESKRPVEDEHYHLPPHTNSLPIVEIDEFLDELSDDREQASRAPTPPPKARARGIPALSTGDALWVDRNANLASADVARPSSVRSASEYSAVLPDRDDNPSSRRTESMRSDAESDGEGDARSTLGSLLWIRPPVSEGSYHAFSANRAAPRLPDAARAAESTASAPTTYYERTTSRLSGRSNSFSVPGRPTRPITPEEQVTKDRGTPSKSTSLGPSQSAAPNPPQASARMPVYIPEIIPTQFPRPSHARLPSIDTATTITTCSSNNSSKGTRRSGSIRSNSSRISTVFSRMTLWKPHHKSVDTPSTPTEDTPEPDDIFGVSLKKSMQIASASARTRHDGDAKNASSRREFPRVILACVSFVRAADGVRAPSIFAASDATLGISSDAAHLRRVAALKEAFSAAPHYGAEIDWARFTVYDAAELVVMFLRQLPKPLVGEAVAKRWVALSRQAAGSSSAARVDECIDFWDEALLGVRGAARSLFKLLLNLWGDVAEAAEVNGMTAERLAATLLGPLMHLGAGKYRTDYMLGLAFLIRRRSEYTVLLRDGGRSSAAFEGASSAQGAVQMGHLF